MGNRERIIDAAIELMNRSGSAVGTNQMAEHLSISPGNLYYHFRNREQIVREILQRLRCDLDAVLEIEADQSLDASRLADCFAGGAKVLWKYRFFFSASLELVTRDEQLAEAYRDFCARGIDQVEKAFRRAVATAPGRLSPASTENRMIAVNLWVLWTSWPRYVDVLRAEPAGESEIFRSQHHLSLMLKPYLAPDYYTAVVTHMRELMRR